MELHRPSQDQSIIDQKVQTIKCLLGQLVGLQFRALAVAQLDSLTGLLSFVPRYMHRKRINLQIKLCTPPRYVMVFSVWLHWAFKVDLLCHTPNKKTKKQFITWNKQISRYLSGQAKDLELNSKHFN